ncbi:MAG: addiction module antitoxin RelB [Spirochaetaceae bacterium]|nr:MAG: addiction module antitoxin RelB [Spirochaetaceae bacterium]
MSVQLPLDTMSVVEKLRAIEDIWSDLLRSPENIPSPDWHRDVLNARERKRKDGSLAFEDWTVAKQRIRNRTRSRVGLDA